MTVVQVEKQQRSPFGWLVAILFWGFNILMALGLFNGLRGVVRMMAETTTDAEMTNATIGAAIGTGLILAIWVTGALILGLMKKFTGGKKVTSTREA